MHIANNILKECLKNVYFINGTAYAGKSTMALLLSQKHDMILCGENYHHALASKAATHDQQPNLCYFKTMPSWQAFISRTPEEYARWIRDTAQEAGEFEIAELLRLSASGKKIVADTNLSVEDLREISDYHRVAIMLSPQSMSVNMFFERADAGKNFILQQIRAADDPEKALANYKACIAKTNSVEVFEHFKNSGFFTLYREDAHKDTRAEVLAALEKHFELV